MADSTTVDPKAEAEAQIQIILRQTDYTYDTALAQLALHNNDYLAVIRSYLQQGISAHTPAPTPLSMNQQIYKEIRTFMKYF